VSILTRGRHEPRSTSFASDASETTHRDEASAAPRYRRTPSLTSALPLDDDTEKKTTSQMLNDPTAGLGFLQDIDGLFIQERVEFLEAFTGCDTKNVYHITPIQRGALPDPTGQMPPEWIERFTRQANFYPLLKAKEESECAERVCCPLFRSFEMDFKDGTGAVFFSLKRPYKCTVHTPCFMCAPQELKLHDAHGAVASTAREEFRFGWCCARSFVAAGGDTNTSGYDDVPIKTSSSKYDSEDYYRVRTSECGTSSGNNCCAPSCFNASYDIDVFDERERNVVARAANVWPGCNCAGATDRSNIILRFPRDADPKRRAALVAATMLVEFAHFEWRKGDNEGGGLMLI
jgi:hypothetical protein